MTRMAKKRGRKPVAGLYGVLDWDFDTEDDMALLEQEIVDQILNEGAVWTSPEGGILPTFINFDPKFIIYSEPPLLTRKAETREDKIRAEEHRARLERQAQRAKQEEEDREAKRLYQEGMERHYRDSSITFICSAEQLCLDLNIIFRPVNVTAELSVKKLKDVRPGLYDEGKFTCSTKHELDFPTYNGKLTPWIREKILNAASKLVVQMLGSQNV